MSLTVSRAFIPPSGGVISINAITPDRMVNPCPVTFEVDISASDFDTSDTYDPVLDVTFANQYEPHRHRLFAFWSFGDTGHWDNVTDEIPAEYSRKDPGLGIRTTHVYTDAAMATAGTSYNVSVLVFEPSSGKVATATTTVTIKHYLLEANRIVLVNNTGDNDFSAFDATETALVNAGWSGTRTNETLASGTFAVSDTAYADHASEHNVVWLLKGNGEAGSPTYDVSLVIPNTSGLDPVFGAYGSGQAKVVNTDDNRVLQLANAGTANSARQLDWLVEGTFDSQTEIPREPGAPGQKGEYLTIVGGGWWLVQQNVTFDKQGSGNGILEIRGTSKVSLCEVNMTDSGSEYAIISGANDPELHVIGCNLLDAPDRLIFTNVMEFTGGTGSFVAGETLTGGTSGATAEIINSYEAGGAGVLYLKAITGTFTASEAVSSASGSATNSPSGGNAIDVNSDVKNSHIRLSNRAKMTIAKSRIFLNRRTSGQYCFKLGNRNNDGSEGHAYFNVLEAAGSIAGFNPVADDFTELKSGILECNICIYTPFTQGIADVSADGVTVRNNACWAPAWSTDVSQGDNTVRPRWLGNIGSKTLSPVWQGAPISFYGNTTICDLTNTQNGVSARFIGINYVVNNFAAHPYPPSDDTPPNLSAANNATYAPNQVINLGTRPAPIDASPSSTDGPRTQNGDLISPKFAGARTYGVYDQTLDLTANNLPSFQLGAGSPTLGEKLGVDPVLDYLGRRRGPKWSTGCAEDDSGFYVTDVATA